MMCMCLTLTGKDKIDVLVEKICNKLKKGLVVGDEVNFTVDDKVMKGEVVEVIQRQTPVVSLLKSPGSIL